MRRDHSRLAARPIRPDLGIPSPRDLEAQLPETAEELAAERRRFSRVRLWAHLVSQHCVVLRPETPLAVLQELHSHEHDGPGTIRNHPRKDRSYSLKKLGEVLAEAEDDD